MKVISCDFFFVHRKISYFQLNKDRYFETAKKYIRKVMVKEKATEYFIDSFERKINKEVPKSIRKRKGSKKSIYGRIRYRNMTKIGK